MPDSKVVRQLSRRRRRQEQPARVHPLRLGQSRRRHVDDQARAAGRVAIERAHEEAEAIGLRDRAADRVRHRVHQHRHNASAQWTRPSSGATATRSSTGSPTTSSRPERYPVLPRVAPGDVRRALPSHAPEQRRAVRRRVRGFRARPRPGADALEPSRVHGLLRELGQPAGRARGVPGGGAQPAGDVVAHFAGVPPSSKR